MKMICVNLYLAYNTEMNFYLYNQKVVLCEKLSEACLNFHSEIRLKSFLS